MCSFFLSSCEFSCDVWFFSVLGVAAVACALRRVTATLAVPAMARALVSLTIMAAAPLPLPLASAVMVPATSSQTVAAVMGVEQ